MTLSRNAAVRILPVAVITALSVAGCASDKTESESAPQAPASSTTAASEGCPTAAPANDVAVEWEFTGATGSIAVTGSTDKAAPKITVNAPFSVDATEVHTLKEGSGEIVPDTAAVSVCYMGVNGRDGSVFDSSYKRGAPVEFSLTGVVPGFSKAIAGQRVGSTVAVAMIPADGYPQGNPAAGINAGDSLVFAIKIVSATG